MTRNDTWFVVDVQFLKRVEKELTRLYLTLRHSYKEPPDKAKRIIKTFRNNHPMGKYGLEFFSKYFRTNLISKAPSDKPGTILIFGFLRTLFLGILRGSPRTNIFTKRVRVYKETYELASSLEEFLQLYRRRIGFTKIDISRTIYRESGTKSECKDLPEYACQPPICRYIRTIRNGKITGYCSRHTRRRRRSIKRDNEDTNE